MPPAAPPDAPPELPVPVGKPAKPTRSTFPQSSRPVALILSCAVRQSSGLRNLTKAITLETLVTSSRFSATLSMIKNGSRIVLGPPLPAEGRGYPVKPVRPGTSWLALTAPLSGLYGSPRGSPWAQGARPRPPAAAAADASVPLGGRRRAFFSCFSGGSSPPPRASEWLESGGVVP